MKHILFLLLLTVGFHTAVSAQKRKPSLNHTPPRILQDEVQEPVSFSRGSVTVTENTPYWKLFIEDENFELAFGCAVNEDTLILPGGVFRKRLQIVPFRICHYKDVVIYDLQIKKGTEPQDPVAIAIAECFNMQVIKDTAILTNHETGSVRKFMLFLDKEETCIAKIQDLESKEFYLPMDVEGIGPDLID